MPKKPTTIQETHPGRFAEVIHARMKERGISIGQLSEKTDIVYEHIRRIVRGDATPSRFTLKIICDVLKLPYVEMLDLTNADKIQAKYGELPLALVGKKANIEPLERVWDDLSPDQQQDLIVMAQGWAKRARASKEAS